MEDKPLSNPRTIQPTPQRPSLIKYLVATQRQPHTRQPSAIPATANVRSVDAETSMKLLDLIAGSEIYQHMTFLHMLEKVIRLDLIDSLRVICELCLDLALRTICLRIPTRKRPHEVSCYDFT